MASLAAAVLSNETKDVTALGCFKDFNTVSCFRESFEAALAILTGFICIAKVAKLHRVRHELINQYCIFYSALVECIICAVNWIYLHSSVVDFVSEFLKLSQFLIVCRFYCQVAARVSKKEHLYKRVLLPALVITFIYFVCLIIAGVVDLKEDFYECLESEWVQLSASEVVLGSVFIVAGLYITRKINAIQTLDAYKKSLKRDLWGIIVTFQFSALLSLSYDITMQVVGEKNHCKGLFIYDLAAYNTINILIKVLKWLLPIWAMAAIFKPQSFVVTREDQENQPPLVRNSSSGPFYSEFRPRGSSFHYKYLFDSPGPNAERSLLAPPFGDLDSYGSTRSGKKKKKRNSSRGSSDSFGSGSPSSAPPSHIASINRRPDDAPLPKSAPIIS